MDIENQNREELRAQIRSLRRRVEELEREAYDAKCTGAQNQDFREILNCLPDIIYRIDEDGRFTFVSDFVSVLGYSPNELLGKHFSTIIHPDDVQRVSRSHVLTRLKGKKTGVEESPALFDERRRYQRIRCGAEIRLLTKTHSSNGHGHVYIDAEVSAAGVYDGEKGREIFRGTIGVIRDITFKQRSAFKKAASLERKYQELLEKTNDAIVHIDQSGALLFANSAFFTLFDISIEEVSNFVDFALKRLDESSIDNFKHFWEDYSQSGVLSDKIDEFCWISSKENVLCTENIASTLSSADASFECLQIIMRDITAKKMLEKALRDSEELFRNLTEKSPLMIAVVSESRILYVNKNVEKTLGYDRKELTEEQFDFCELFIPEYREEIKQLYERLLRNETVKDFECIMQSRDKRRIDVIYSASSIRYQGKVAILNTIIDVAERKILEEKTRNAQKLESLGVLAGGIAHDFNNILTVIIGNITLCRINPNDPELVVKNLSAAEEAVSRARELTRQFLAFSRNTAPLKKIMPLNGIIRDSVMFSSSGSKVKLDLSISEDLWPAEVDDGQIGQVISNIVINALQSMPDGGTLTVRASNKVIYEGSLLPLPPGNYVKISIKDTGVGIEPENLRKIFDPYFSTKEMESGLGLAIAYSIVSKHGGHIDVESEPKVGSVFTVYLPAIADVAVGESTSLHAHRDGKQKILLMDDDEGVIAVVSQFLSYLGYEYATARDGREAVDIYTQGLKENKPFAVVILDLAVVGGMGGKEALVELKKMDPQVRAVLTTGYLDNPVVLNYHEYGFVDLIKKPFRIEELNRILHRALS